MAHSREVRLPFLDRRVAEFCLSLPADFAYRRQTRKAILREAVRGVVPDAVLARRDKIGFEPPQKKWLAEPAFIALIAEVLLDAQARGRGLYNSHAIEDDVSGRQWRDPAGAWRALNLELWLRSVAR
jgi:asparagine synthase (glutamine-hydrolysing)